MSPVPYVRRIPNRKSLGVLVLAVFAWGCDVLGGHACTTELVYGINVTALDADTDAAVTEGLRGVAIRDTTTFDLEVWGNRLVGAGEAAGRFVVVVSATGYELWTKGDVMVMQGDCHVRPVSLEARLRAETEAGL